jgi:hypothetical protein
MAHPAPQDIRELDRNFAALPVEDGLRWIDARLLTLEGRAWAEVGHPLDRLPQRAQGVVRDAVWQLSRHSAGLAVRFVTDATRLAARWTLRSEATPWPHMTTTAANGLDLYARLDGRWRWAAPGLTVGQRQNTATLLAELPPGRREMMLYLPLYNGVDTLAIGVPPEAVMTPGPARPARRRRPLCFYGTSVVQGGCASRPGLAYPAILGRRLDRPAINLGFSGNAQMEPELAALLAELDPCAYVLDAVPNVNLAMTWDRVEPFVRTLRRARPATPIVLVESIVYQNAPFRPRHLRPWIDKNAVLWATYERLAAAGVPGLSYVPSHDLLGDDGEATIDSVHLTDLGFMRLSDRLEPVLRRLVKD